MTGSAASRRWLLSRVDQRCSETHGKLLGAVSELLGDVAELLAIATGDAIVVRALSTDRLSLLPVATSHPDPDSGSAMADAMGATVHPSDAGLWGPVVSSHKPRRWRIHPGEPPAEASARQVEFLERFPVRAVLGVPLLVGNRLVGGLAVVRYSVAKEFTDEDETLVTDCARRIAPFVDLLRLVGQLEPGGGQTRT